MISDFASYRAYRRADIHAHHLTRVSFYNYWWIDTLRFQLRLRKIEYLYNVRRHWPLSRITLFLLEVINHRLGTRLGLSIPKNVFGPGLCIVHPGTIVVNPKAKVGKNCRIHPSTCIGECDGVPSLGDDVYIAPGAKLYGGIMIGDNVAIGANAVVNHSFGSHLTIGGAPARILSHTGAIEQGVFGERSWLDNLSV